MAIKKFAIIGACALAAAFAFGGCGGSKPPQEKDKDRNMTNHAIYDAVALPDELWSAPTYKNEPSLDRTESETKSLKGSIKGIYYRSDYNGQESYAFAYLGVPDDASESNKKPAVLLVHGGGGTAYWQWVAEWVRRGYVALAMDLEGHVPLMTGTSDNIPADLYEKSEYTAPHNTNYGDASKPIEETWMYYAVSTVIRGNSLLHSLDCVNRNKVGVCGVSWGGVITSIVTSYDDRFAFSIPIYCSLNIAGTSGNLASYYKNHYEACVWDGDTGLSLVNTPVFILASDCDINASPQSFSETYEHLKNGKLAVVHNFPHSHTHAFARPEPYAYADGAVKGGAGLISVISEPEGASGTVEISVPQGIRLKRVCLMATDSDFKKVADWERLVLEEKNGVIAYDLSAVDLENIAHYYIYAEDENGCVVSTKVVAL